MLALVKVESVAEFAPPTISPIWLNPLLIFLFLIFISPSFFNTLTLQTPIPLSFSSPLNSPPNHTYHLPSTQIHHSLLHPTPPFYSMKLPFPP